MRHATDSGRLLLGPLRRQQIVELLEQGEFLTNAQICIATHSSIATVRRDLTLLERMGRLVRVRGGVVPARPAAAPGTGWAVRQVARALTTLRAGDVDGAEVLLRAALEACQKLRASTQ